MCPAELVSECEIRCNIIKFLSPFLLSVPFVHTGWIRVHLDKFCWVCVRFCSFYIRFWLKNTLHITALVSCQQKEIALALLQDMKQKKGTLIMQFVYSCYESKVHVVGLEWLISYPESIRILPFRSFLIRILPFRSGDLMTKNGKIFTVDEKFIFWWIKTGNIFTFSPPSRSNLHASLQKRSYSTSELCFVGHFCPPGSGSSRPKSMRIPIHNAV